MRNGQMVLLACRVSPGGFSGERVFRIPLADGAIHIGTAPVEYCFSESREPIGKGEPKPGQAINGYVEGRIIANGGANAEVEMPDGEIVVVNMTTIRYVEKEGNSYVSVG
jgi:hypothetical protein